MQDERDLIEELLDALKLTKYDAEHNGFEYGPQANVVKVIKRAEKYLSQTHKKDMT